jgi:hypothetical protein
MKTEASVRRQALPGGDRRVHGRKSGMVSWMRRASGLRGVLRRQ